MGNKIIIHDYITSIREIIADEFPEKRARLRRVIYRMRKLNNRQFYKQYTVDQTVDELLNPVWLARIRQYNLSVWRDAATATWKKTSSLLGRVPPPEIILYPGFSQCNGRVYKLDRQPIMVCSPDFPGCIGKNLDILVAHEYAHFIRWRTTGISSDNIPVYATIYEEGWATWLSYKIHPHFRLSQLFMANLHKSIGRPDPSGGYVAWCRKHLVQIIDTALLGLQSKDREDIGSLFQGMRLAGDGTPIRTGYYLGYQMLEMLSRNYEQQELLHMRPTRKRVSSWLQELRDLKA